MASIFVTSLEQIRVPAIILHFMKRSDELLSSFDNSWKGFSQAWKKARAKASEKSVHDLRVNTRRLIANLELARSLSQRDDIAKLQRHFKKVLKGIGPLRDLQVQLETVAHLRQDGLVADFKRVLERREGREIKTIQDELTRGRKQRLAKKIKEVREEFSRFFESTSDPKIQRSIERVLNARRNELLKAERRFRRLQPLNEEVLHEVRLALKKLRYVLEAAQPVLKPSVKAQAQEMHSFQQLIGDSRDLEILRAELEKWAKKRGKKIAIVPALETLNEKRESLIRKFVDSADQFEQLIRAEPARPVIERTHAVPATVPTNSGAIA
jgi:CHAD domain-containing protein